MESHKRTIVKTISFKFFTTTVSAFFMGIGNAIALHALLTVVFYVHERVWDKIEWQKS